MIRRRCASIRRPALDLGSSGRLGTVDVIRKSDDDVVGKLKMVDVLNHGRETFNISAAFMIFSEETVCLAWM